MSFKTLLSLLRDLLSLIFIFLKVGNSFFFPSNVKIKILPLCFKFFLQRNNNLFIFLKVNKWIVCLIKIKSNFFVLVKKNDVASDFLKFILLSLSLWFIISIPVGLLLSFKLDFIVPKILPRPHPISNISEFGFNFIFLNKNLLNDLM